MVKKIFFFLIEIFFSIRYGNSVVCCTAGAGGRPAAAGSHPAVFLRAAAPPPHLSPGAAHGPATLHRPLQPSLHYQARQELPLPREGDSMTVSTGDPQCCGSGMFPDPDPDFFDKTKIARSPD